MVGGLIVVVSSHDESTLDAYSTVADESIASDGGDKCVVRGLWRGE